MGNMILVAILSSIITGYSVVKTKKIVEGIRVSEYLKASVILDAIFSIPVYLFLNYGKSFTVVSIDYRCIFILIIYLLFRIVSNMSQTLLNKDVDTNINVVSMVLSTSCFITIILYPSNMSFIVLISIILAMLGSIICVINFGNMELSISKRAIVLLFIAYITSGTKPVMGNYLLNYFSIGSLVLLEILNYTVVYSIAYRKIKIDFNTIKDLIPVTILSTISIVLSYYLFREPIVFILTSFTNRIFVLLFSVFLLKKRLTRKEVVGSILTALGVSMYKRNS